MCLCVLFMIVRIYSTAVFIKYTGRRDRCSRGDFVLSWPFSHPPPIRPPDPGLWRHEPWVGWKRMAAQPGSAPVPLLLHGVSGGCPYAWSPHQEGTEGPAEDGGQFPQVWTSDVYTHCLSLACISVDEKLIRLMGHRPKILLTTRFHFEPGRDSKWPLRNIKR